MCVGVINIQEKPAITLEQGVAERRWRREMRIKQRWTWWRDGKEI